MDKRIFVLGCIIGKMELREIVDIHLNEKKRVVC
jgi:hypothetical protein